MRFIGFSILLVATLFLFCAANILNNTTLRGKLLDNTTIMPLENASITIVSDTWTKTLYTNEEGKFKIAELKEGVYEIIIRKTGYKEEVIENFEVSHIPPCFLLVKLKPRNYIFSVHGRN